MGYMRHHAILVTTFDEQRAKRAHDKAVQIFNTGTSEVVTHLSEEMVNGYISFAIFPDGSKEGWPDSDSEDEHRSTFREWLETQRYEDHSSYYNWVEVQYGDDNCETKIVADSDKRERELLEEESREKTLSPVQALREVQQLLMATYPFQKDPEGGYDYVPLILNTGEALAVISKALKEEDNE